MSYYSSGRTVSAEQNNIVCCTFAYLELAIVLAATERALALVVVVAVAPAERARVGFGTAVVVLFSGRPVPGLARLVRQSFLGAFDARGEEAATCGRSSVRSRESHGSARDGECEQECLHHGDQ